MLRPGGRFAVSDVIADPDMDEATRADMQQWTGCVAGALTRERVRGGARRRRLRRRRDPRDPPRARARELGDRSGAQARVGLTSVRAVRSRRRAAAAYPLLLALGALDAAGYSVIVPVAPAIADATGAGPGDDRAAGGVLPGRHGARLRVGGPRCSASGSQSCPGGLAGAGGRRLAWLRARRLADGLLPVALSDGARLGRASGSASPSTRSSAGPARSTCA